MPTRSSPTIEAIETTVFRLPMRGALQWGASSRMAEVRHVLVHVRLSDGAEGYAEAPPRPTIYGETPTTICAVIAEEMAPRIVGMPVLEIAELEEGQDHAALSEPMIRIQNRLHEVKNNNTARGALDMALHDAAAQSSGVSLAERLGATRDRVRVSYILGIGERDSVLEEAASVVEQGVRVLKVKVGRDWQDDIERIIDLREALGSTVDLYADANETMTAENAASRLEQLAEMGLLYCEEPLPVEQVTARRQLHSGQHLPIIADDSTFSLRDLNRELELNTFDVLNIKTSRTGYTESLRMLAANEAAGKGCMVGSQASAGLGTARAALVAALPGVAHPSELSFPLKLQADIVKEQMPIVDGYMRVADALAVRVDKGLLNEMAEHVARV